MTLRKIASVVIAASLAASAEPAPPSAAGPEEAIDTASNSNHIFSREPLAAVPYSTLPLTAIEPQGWLREQLRRMGEGMAGQLGEVYPNVGPVNAWRGGAGDAWERGPYWLDGLVPLAYMLDDEDLIEQARDYIEWTLASQDETGFFGPRESDETDTSLDGMQTGNKEDWWPRMIVLKALQSYYDATGDQRIIDFMTKYFRYQLEMLPEKPIGHWTHWSKSRGGENQASVYWLYNRTGDEFLLELAPMIFEQTRDWTTGFFEDSPASTHGVNIGMGVKQPAINYLQTRDPRYLRSVDEGFEYLLGEHGQINGVFSGDELLHGDDPTHGTETCTVVELMYSLETLMAMTGRVDFADHLEQVAYNALPTLHTDDYWGRQYFQQPNQILVTKEPNRDRNFMTNHDGMTNLFGLLNGYPCCTTNLHQGWPKLARHLWLASEDNGLAAMIYAPSTVEARVADGVEVRFVEETNYPFEDTIRFTFESDQEVEFPLHLRVPEWTRNATVRLNGEKVLTSRGGRVIQLDREWSDGDVVELTLPMSIRLSHWPENAVGVHRGPLVFALNPGEERTKIDEHLGVPLWEVRPTGPWNYGLVVNRRHPDRSFEVVKTETEAEYPWSPEATPIRLVAQARRIPTWREYNLSAGPAPHSPARTDEPVEEVTLIPYGATTLRIAVFPTARDAGEEH